MSSAGEAVARGRPKSESKKEQIHHAASRLFLEHGYDGVNMDQVAIQAGVSKQTVYSHFDSKEALFSACIRHKCEAHQLPPAALDPALPVEQVLLRVVTQYNALFHSDEAIRLKRLLCAHADTNPRLSEIFYAAGPDLMKQTLEAYLQGQVDREVLAIADIPTAARQLLYMMQGEHLNRAMLNVSGGPSEADNGRYLKACVDLFLRGYRRD